jgi:hypothetical protein
MESTPYMLHKLIRIADRPQVAHAAIGAERGERLVFRPAVFGEYLLVAVLGLDDPLATDDAGVAGVAAELVLRPRFRAAQQFQVKPLAADGLGRGNIHDAAVPIVRRQTARSLLAHHRVGRAVAAEALHVAALGHQFRPAARQGDDGLLVRRSDRQRAANGDGLQVLAAHHRADAGAAPGAVAHVHHGGEIGQLFARRADLGDLDLLVAVFGFQDRIDVVGIAAPQVAGVAQLGRAVVDPQVDRRRRRAADDDGVEAGKLQFGRPEAARLAVGHAARGR